MAGARNMPNNGISVGDITVLVTPNPSEEGWGPVRTLLSLALLAPLSPPGDWDLTVFDNSTGSELSAMTYGSQQQANSARDMLVALLGEIPQAEWRNPDLIHQLLEIAEDG